MGLSVSLCAQSLSGGRVCDAWPHNRHRGGPLGCRQQQLQLLVKCAFDCGCICMSRHENRIDKRIPSWWPHLFLKEEALWFSLARMRKEERTELEKKLER